MSNAALNHVWATSKAKGSALLVMIAIADQANDDGECFPGQTRLAAKCRMSDRYLRDLLAKLVDLGELLVITHGGIETKAGKTNRYKVLGMEPVDHAARNSMSGIEDTKGGTPVPVVPKGRNPSSTQGRNPSSYDPKEEPKDSIARQKKRAAKPKPKAPTIPAAQMNPMKDAIVLAFKWDAATMNRSEWGKVQAAARDLIQSKLTPDDVPGLHAYCVSAFDAPGPNALATNVQKWRASQPKRTNGATQPAPAFVYNADAPAHDCNDGIVFIDGKSAQCPTCQGSVQHGR